MSARLGLPEGLTVQALQKKLEASPPPRAAVIVVDAVDESDAPDTLRDALLIPLARRHGLRLLLGLRLPLPADMIADLTVDLDSSEYQDPEALVDYAANVLVATSEPNVATPYRGVGVADEPVYDIARAIAEAATSDEGAESFLIAQALAVALRGRTQRVAVDDTDWKQTVPRDLAEAFTEDLNRFDDRTDVANTLLEALAWSNGPGLPWETIWAPVAQRLSALRAGQPEVKPTDADIRWLLAQVGYFIVEDTGPGKSSVFRPFHDRFADYLRDRLVPPTDDADAAAARRREVQATIAAALLSTLTDGDQRRWDRAHPYLRTYLAEHARDAGPDIFASFLEDGGFLAAADPATLTALMSSTSPTQREIARVYRRCRPLLGSNAAVNAAHLLEAAMALGAPAMSLADTGITPIYSTVLVDTYPDRSLVSFPLVPQVRALAFGRLGDGPLVLAATNFSQRTRVWEVESVELVSTNNRFIPQYAAPVALAVLPEGRMVLAAGSPDGSVQLLDVLTGALLAHSSPTGVGAVAVKFDARDTGAPLLLVAFEDGTAQLFSADTCESRWPPMQGLRGKQVAVAWSDNTILVACGDNDGTVMIYDGRTGAIVAQFSVHDGREVSSIEFGFSTDGAAIVATGHGDGVVQLWHPLSGNPVCAPLVGHLGRVMALAFGRLAPNRSVLASGSYDNTIRVWDATSGALIGAPLVGHSGAVVALNFGVTEAGDTLLASAGGDNAVRVWGPLVPTPAPADSNAMPFGIPAVSAVALGASTRIPHLAAFSRYSVLHLRDLSNGARVADLQYRGHIFSAALATNTEGRAYVAVAGRVGIDLWDADAMRHIATLPHPASIVHNLAFGPAGAPNARLLVALSLDGILRAWSVDDRDGVVPVAISYGGARATAMTVTPSRAGQELVAIGDETGTVTIWDPRTDQQLEQYHDHNSRINAVAAGTSPAGHVLISSASEDNRIAVRDLDTGDLVTRLSQPPGTSSLAFGAAADGRALIVSASQAGFLTIWDLERQARVLTLLRRTAVHSIAADRLRLAVGDRESFAVIDVDDHAV